MSLKKIIKKINDDAETEVRKIIAKSKQEAEEVKKKQERKPPMPLKNTF